MPMNPSNWSSEVQAAVDAAVAADPNGQPSQATLWDAVAGAHHAHITGNAQVDHSSVATVISPAGTAGGPCTGTLGNGVIS